MDCSFIRFYQQIDSGASFVFEIGTSKSEAFDDELLFRHMEQVAREGNFDVKIDNVTDDLGVMSVAGPLSRNVFTKATGDEDLVTKWKFLDAKKVAS